MQPDTTHEHVRARGQLAVLSQGADARTLWGTVLAVLHAGYLLHALLKPAPARSAVPAWLRRQVIERLHGVLQQIVQVPCASRCSLLTIAYQA